MADEVRGHVLEVSDLGLGRSGKKGKVMVNKLKFSISNIDN